MGDLMRTLRGREMVLAYCAAAGVATGAVLYMLLTQGWAPTQPRSAGAAWAAATSSRASTPALTNGRSTAAH